MGCGPSKEGEQEPSQPNREVTASGDASNYRNEKKYHVWNCCLCRMEHEFNKVDWCDCESTDDKDRLHHRCERCEIDDVTHLMGDEMKASLNKNYKRDVKLLMLEGPWVRK